MSEDTEADRRPAGRDPLLAASLAAAANSARYDDLIARQIRLADLQIDSLEKQDEYELSHLRWRRFNDQMKGALEMILVAFASVILIGVGAAIWNASQADGLVIESFSVPPDMIQKGLSGDVIAGKVLDRLQTFQAQTASSRAASSYANDWGSNVKVQIPNTGVSVSDLNRYLRQWLGHETHIFGEVYRTATGIAITARLGSSPGSTYAGTDADLDKLVQKAAESVYRSTQPYRYAVYLDTHKRPNEATAIYRSLIRSGSPLDRAWAYIGLGNQAANKQDVKNAAKYYRHAIAAKPDLLVGYAELSMLEGEQENSSVYFADTQRFLHLAARGKDSSMDQREFRQLVLAGKWNVAGITRDFAAFKRISQESDTLSWDENPADSRRYDEIVFCAGTHDLSCARKIFAEFEPTNDAQEIRAREERMSGVFLDSERWPEAEALWRRMTPSKSERNMFEYAAREYNPTGAEIYSHLGDFEAAHALVDKSPFDCSFCLRVRGEIRWLERKWNAAAFWFAKASVIGAPDPSIPTEWGRMLMMRGHYDGAIAKFKEANAKGPHWADPLEMWGEALIATNRSDLALPKFEEANKYAPNWGRLHLKWGEALLWSGDKAGAQKQFAAAAHLDLTPSEKSQLARMEAIHG